VSEESVEKSESADPEFELVRETWAAFNRDDLEGGLAHIHPDATIVPFGAALEGQSYKGHEEIRRWWVKEIRSTWEHFGTVPIEFTKAGKFLVVYGFWRARGQSSGVDLDVPATWVIEVRDGRIAGWWTFTDRAEAHRMVGLEA
jgi:ketosteroid isomerase-like protein